MKKMIATIALVAAAGLAGSAASAQIGVYPGGLPGDGPIVGGPDYYPGHWSYGGPNAAPSNLPVAVHDAQRAAIWGAFGSRFYGGARGRDDILRLREADDDLILRRLDP